VSYRVGVGGGMAALGFQPCDPAIICDGCGLVRPVVSPGRMGPPAWFLDSKSPPKWKQGKRLPDGARQDFCPRCK
jgi:hypothetical protein